ncbi:MAG: tRNA 2-thiouridine(34) synthase MnmA [Candidatus Aminicenantia bacterium]
MRKKRVVVAMSGGVDSSVTAALLKEQGYEVIGLTMNLWSSDKLANRANRYRGCCGLRAMRDANQVAIKLKIPHYVADFRDIFNKTVIADFCREYNQGRTPNPCIRCNQYIKFEAMLKKSKKLEADFIATGHYARIEYGIKRKRYLLKKGIDSKKDQSYVLYAMTQDQLSQTLMPLGNLTKKEVREIARKLDLPVAEKSESQEICFIPDNNYPQFLKNFIPEAAKPGLIINRKGVVLGKHKGIIFYTIGQRRGLGISAKEPLYVISIDKSKNTIVVGSKEEVYSQEFTVSDINWIAWDKIEKSFRAKVKIRYIHQEAEAAITLLNDNQALVKFIQPQRAITSGQAAVFYDGDVVIGGGTIEKVESMK